jgi:prepilin-type processing-associated H-X9-DG protein
MCEFHPFCVKFTRPTGEGRLALTILQEKPQWHWPCWIHSVKLRVSNRGSRALTLLEVVVVICSLFILVVILLPALGAAAVKRNAIGCVNHLGQMGLALRIWEGDHEDKYPMGLSATNGGAMEWAALGNAEAIVQAMSNELSNPKMLVCPADKGRWPVPSFRTPLASSNLSYFVNLDSTEANPQDIMMGDDNLEIRGVRVKSGLLTISSNAAITWSADRHRFRGNVAMADGSVQGVSDFGLNSCLCSTNASNIRLAIP